MRVVYLGYIALYDAALLVDEHERGHIVQTELLDKGRLKGLAVANDGALYGVGLQVGAHHFAVDIKRHHQALPLAAKGAQLAAQLHEHGAAVALPTAHTGYDEALAAIGRSANLQADSIQCPRDRPKH